MKLSYYKNLDGVRAIAALMVVVFHFFQGIEPNSKIVGVLSKLSIFGQTGVTLFFVLSGFLITRILIATKNTEGFFKNFYLRRTLRIFPLYYVFLFTYYYIIPLIVNNRQTVFSQQLYYYTYLQNFASTFNWDAAGPGHFWSLAVEEHFYMFWPFIVYFFSTKKLTKLIGAIVLGAMVLRVLMLNMDYEVFYFTFTRFDSLAIGAYLAILEINGFIKKQNIKKFGLLLISLFVPTIIMWTIFSGQGNNYIQIFKYFFLSSIYFSTIGLLLCIDSKSLINRLLRTKFFSYTGKISYGLYVYHPLVYMLCEEFLHINNLFLSFIVGLGATYFISAISFHSFESAFLKLKKYFNYSTKQRKIQSLN